MNYVYEKDLYQYTALQFHQVQTKVLLHAVEKNPYICMSIRNEFIVIAVRFIIPRRFPKKSTENDRVLHLKFKSQLFFGSKLRRFWHLPSVDDLVFYINFFIYMFFLFFNSEDSKSMAEAVVFLCRHLNKYCFKNVFNDVRSSESVARFLWPPVQLSLSFLLTTLFTDTIIKIIQKSTEYVFA